MPRWLVGFFRWCRDFPVRDLPWLVQDWFREYRQLYRIARWQGKYAGQIYKRGRDYQGKRLSYEMIKQSGAEAWRYALTDTDGNIEEALAKDPIEEANEELCNWDNVPLRGRLSR